MIGGGKWTSQNKTLSGVYINFVSNPNTKPTSSDDSNNDTDVESKNIAVLGIATIGYLILGTNSSIK